MTDTPTSKAKAARRDYARLLANAARTIKEVAQCLQEDAEHALQGVDGRVVDELYEIANATALIATKLP